MIYVVLIVFGLCIGSFVNALVYRVHEQSKKSKKPKKELSILNGRSMCVHCHHELVWKDLVPVLSWLSLGGKCRYCRKKISWQYPLVELVTAGLFVLSYVYWPESSMFSLRDVINFTSWLAVIAGLVALSVYDLRWMLLPNRIMYPMTVLALGLAVFNIISEPAGQHLELLLNTFYAVLIAGGLFYLLFQVSSGRWIGGGDVKLGLLIGLLLQDPYKAFLALLTASLLGVIVIIPGLLLGRVTARSKLPFGPFLIAGLIIAYIFGADVIEWYKASVLLLN